MKETPLNTKRRGREGAREEGREVETEGGGREFGRERDGDRGRWKRGWKRLKWRQREVEEREDKGKRNSKSGTEHEESEQKNST